MCLFFSPRYLILFIYFFSSHWQRRRLNVDATSAHTWRFRRRPASWLERCRILAATPTPHVAASRHQQFDGQRSAFAKLRAETPTQAATHFDGCREASGGHRDAREQARRLMQRLRKDAQKQRCFELPHHEHKAARSWSCLAAARQKQLRSREHAGGREAERGHATGGSVLRRTPNSDRSQRSLADDSRLRLLLRRSDRSEDRNICEAGTTWTDSWRGRLSQRDRRWRIFCSTYQSWGQPQVRWWPDQAGTSTWVKRSQRWQPHASSVRSTATSQERFKKFEE